MKQNVKIENKVALVTGANRGIGKAIVEDLLAKGAKKVYLGVRSIDKASDLVAKYKDRVVPVTLDVSKQSDIDNLPESISEVDILVNNAGLLDGGSVVDERVEESLNNNLEVNLFGVLRLTNKLLPSLKTKKEAAIVTVGSVVSFASMPVIGTYSISKVAIHSAIQSYRSLLADSPILVAGVYPGPIDTDMAKDFEMDKGKPKDVADVISQGIENGVEYIFPDEMAKQAGSAYLSDPLAVEEMFSSFK